MEGVKTNYLVCIGLTLYIFLIGAKYGYLLCKAGILTVSVPTLLSSLKNAVNSNLYSSQSKLEDTFIKIFLL